MSTEETLFLIAGLAHIIVASYCLSDLWTKSRRPFKPAWSLFIALVPIFGTIVYNHTKKRRRLLF